MTTSVVTVVLPDKAGGDLNIQMLKDDVTNKLYNVFFDPVTLTPINPTSTVPVAGSDAHDAAPAANPFPGAVLARTSPAAAVSNGDVVRATGTIYGEALAIGALREMKVRQQATITNTAAAATILTADAAYKLDLYGLVLINRSATDCYVTIKDDTTTVAILNVPKSPAPATGFTLTVDSAIPQTAVNKAWTATCSSNSVDSIEITALAVKHL